MRLRPLNSRSESLLTGRMQGDPRVAVVQRKDNKVLVASLRGNFCAWVSLKGDKNWELILAS